MPHEEYAEDAGGEAWYYLGVQVDAHVPVGSHRMLPDWHGEYGWLMAGIRAKSPGMGRMNWRTITCMSCSTW